VSPDKGAYGTRRTRRKALTKVNSLRSNPRFVIALHSPCALREPDRIYLRRNAGTVTPFTTHARKKILNRASFVLKNAGTYCSDQKISPSWRRRLR